MVGVGVYSPLFFMNKVERIRKELQKIDIIEEISISLKQSTSEIIRLNNKQNSEGDLSDGMPIWANGYSIWWGGVRSREGLQVSHIDLRYTGNFYASKRVEVTKTEYKVSSSVSYASSLIDRYSTSTGKVLGLTKESKGIIAQQYLKPLITKQLKRKIK